MSISVSVIIPSYNSHSTIKLTLDHLLKQDGNYLKEIIVVDSSDDGKTRELLQRYQSKIVLQKLDDKIMPAIGRNIGAHLAGGTILAFIDSDAYPEPDWIVRIVNAYRSGIKVGGGSYLIPDAQRFNPIALSQYYIQFSEFLKRGKQRRKDFVPSCNLFCERAIFLRQNEFPEIRAMEDVLFGRNLNKETPLIFLPDLSVSHIFRTSIKSFLDNQFMLGQYNGVSRYGKEKAGKMFSLVFYLFFPVFFVMKITLITCRMFRTIDKNSFMYIISLPLVMLGVWFWAMGFVNSLKICGVSSEQ